jgi:hypothetical protein
MVYGKRPELIRRQKCISIKREKSYKGDIRVHGTDQHVEQCVSALLAWKTSVQDGSDIGVVIPRLYKHGANGMEHNNGVGALGGSDENEFIATMPEGKVLQDNMGLEEILKECSTLTLRSPALVSTVM